MEYKIKNQIETLKIHHSIFFNDFQMGIWFNMVTPQWVITQRLWDIPVPGYPTGCPQFADGLGPSPWPFSPEWTLHKMQTVCFS